MRAILKWVTLAAVVLGLFVPYLVASAFGGFSTGEISAQFFDAVLIIPAGYAFAIWGPIYLGFVAFAVFQALPAQQNNPRIVRTRPWFIASVLLNGVWLAVFEALWFTASLVVIVAMLVTALVMHRTLAIGSGISRGWLERLITLPFSLYAAWLSAATILNASGVLAINGWQGWGISDVTWALLMLIIAAVLALVIRFAWHDPIYAGVFVWTFVAIVVAQTPWLINLTATVAAFAVGVALTPMARRLMPAT